MYSHLAMGGVTVLIFSFLISFVAWTSAAEKTNVDKKNDIFSDVSERLQNSIHPVDGRSQIQLRKPDTDISNLGSCHCTCNCNIQPTREYGLRPICPSYYSNCDSWSLEMSRDCQELYKNGYTRNGVYVIYPDGIQNGIYVRCDMETAGGGWTVIQRRVNGDVDFYRNWSEYKQGFGDLNGNFWVGNDNIHALTTQGNYQLRIDLSLSDTNKTYATYSTFKVGDKNSGYFMTAEGYSGTAGDSFSYHSGSKFSTKDQDNGITKLNCAASYKGAWWYKSCHHSNLNGIYGSVEYGQGINWLTFSGYYTSLVYADMKVRKK